MDALDESWVERKLLTATNTQESVQSLSMWALHHKTQHERIVAIWFRVLKAAKLDLRLTLFYLCNEVVQTCRRKHAVVYKDAFKDVLKDAALLVRDISIRPNIERIFKIWAERGVYDAKFVEELLVLLNNTQVKTAMSTKLLADFTPSRLMDQLMNCAQLEEAVEEQREALANVDVDALDISSFKHQLKDRNQGIEYADELEAACHQIKNYVNNLETEMKERATLIELLEQSQLYYDAQSSEANVVATAYKTFGGRVAAVKKKLEEHRALLKAAMSSPEDVYSDNRKYFNEHHHETDSVDDGTPCSYIAEREDSEDSNSPLAYINPSDYIDEPLNDEDIFLFSSDNKASDACRTEQTPSKSVRVESSRRSSAEQVHKFSPEHHHGDISPTRGVYSRDRSSRTSSIELTHRLSPTERANLIFHKEHLLNRASHISEQQPAEKRSRNDSSEWEPGQRRRLSSNEQSRRLSTESDTSSRRRRYSYSNSSSSVSRESSPTPRSASKRTRSKDSVGSASYIQPALSFLPRNIASLGSQKQPEVFSDVYAPSGGATPTRDEEGGETPVLDEPDDDEIKFSSPLDHSASKPANNYMQLQRQIFASSSDHSAHRERLSYSTGSDVGSDAVPSYDKTCPAELEKVRHSNIYAVDSDHSRPVVLEGFQPKPEQYRIPELYRAGEQEYPSGSTISYHPSPAAGNSATPDVIYRHVDNYQPGLPSDVPQAVPYFPYAREPYSSSSIAELPKTQVYQQPPPPPPDFQVQPIALYNPSLPPPGMPLPSMSIVPPPNLPPPVSLAAPTVPALSGSHQTCMPYSLPPPPPPGSGAMVAQQPTPPLQQLVQRALPNVADTSLPVFSATSSHLLPPPTSQLVAPPRRGDYLDQPQSGSFIATVSGNGDTVRQSYLQPDFTSSQPIKSITSSRRHDRDYSAGRASGSPIGKRHVLCDERYDDDDNGFVESAGRIDGAGAGELEALQIPTLACTQSVLGDREYRSRPQISPRTPTGRFQPFVSGRQPGWF